MICRVCHRQAGRTATACPTCGAAPTTASTAFELVLSDRTRVPLVRELTIGRAPGNAVQLVDPSVSRIHARISPPGGGGGPVLQDAGSSHGTWVDGRRLDGPLVLRDGARVVLGDQELVVERRRNDAEAGHTVVVLPGASVVLPSAGQSQPVGSTGPTQPPIGAYPRLRSGYALKRLEAAEGTRRWVLKDLVGQRLVHMSDADADLLQIVDGRHSVADLAREAEQKLGPAGPAKLALLLSDLSSRGLLAGASLPTPGGAEAGRLERLFRPRRKAWAGAGDLFERAYLRGGWVLFTRPVLAAIAATAVAGLAAFAYLVAARYGTPFVVARKVGLGALVFIAGRLTLAALHEAAHGLTMASYGRQVGEAGLKLVLVFPYTFVDTSDAWFEPRRRRIAVSAAGPVCDLVLGGSFALCCLAAPAGMLRDILFQLAFGAYYGALFNLNPLLERDGYQILVDVVRQPGLRRRALEQLRRRLAGRRRETDSRLLGRYAIFALAWMLVVAGFATALSLHYQPALAAFLPAPAAWALLAAIWAGLLAPPLVIVLPSLRERLRSGKA
jgi:putative peptide zinc metalloprotease protein